MNSNLNLPIVLAISGASGSIYGLRTLQFLLQNNYSVELIISQSALKVAKAELGIELSLESNKLIKQVLSYMSDFGYSDIDFNAEFLNIWDFDNIAASIASGSFKTMGMIVIPSSMGTISAIASGMSDDLISRAADVCIKEKRKLVLVPREMPYSTLHLENLLRLSKIGVNIAPASPGFYHKPKSLVNSVDFVVGKVLDLFDIEHSLFKRWEGHELFFSK